MRNNRRLMLSQEFLDEHQLSSLPPPANSLFWKLWNANVELAIKALNTKFIKGIQNAKLDPIVYGGFNVSDAYYCFHGADDYLTAYKKANDPTLKAFLLKKYESYDSYNKSFPKTWHVKDANGIDPLEVCKQYSTFESETVSMQDSIYALIVMLPCEYLWAWLGEQLSPPSKGNLYAPWITGNNDPSGAYAMGNFIDLYQKAYDIDEALAMNIYSTAMNYELDNFKAAMK